MEPTPFLFDGHTDLPSRLWGEPASLEEERPGRHVDLPRLRRGGVGGVVLALYVPAELDVDEGFAHALCLAVVIRAQLRRGGLELARSPAELPAIAARGGIAGMLSLENGRPLVRAGALDRLLAEGVRLVTLTHVKSHEWCDAAGDDEVHGGLPPAGEEMVRELNRRGVVVDVSHVSDRATAQVLETSRAPVVASHSSARALCDHPRNLPDDLAREIVRRGGLVMVNAFPVFLDDTTCRAGMARLAEIGPQLAEIAALARLDPVEAARRRDALVAAAPLPSVPLSRYADHILHLVEAVGEEGVGLGTDFDGIPETPVGLEDCSRFPDLVAELERRGLRGRARDLVLGENFRRVWQAVEAAAVE